MFALRQSCPHTPCYVATRIHAVYITNICAQWRSWIMHCATNRKVAGSVLDGVVGIFHRLNPSRCTMALGTTHTLIEMNNKDIAWR